MLNCSYMFCAFILWFMQKKKKKNQLSKAVPQPTVNDTACQMPAVRRSDDPVTPPVF